MTLRNILEKAAVLLGITVDFDNVGEEEKLFIECGKEVLSVLTGEYTDIKTTEKVSSSDRKIYYSSLVKDVKRIIYVEYRGEKVKFKEYAKFITVPADGEYDVIYSYNLTFKKITNDIELPPRFSVNILAAGVAGEYCFRKGFYSEAEAYGKRYESALKNILRPSGAVVWEI